MLPFEEDGSGKKALLFSYKLYLLPNGDLKTATSNVEPEKLSSYMLGEMGQDSNEYVNTLKSAIKFLLEEVKLLDEELADYIGA